MSKLILGLSRNLTVDDRETVWDLVEQAHSQSPALFEILVEDRVFSLTGYSALEGNGKILSKRAVNLRLARSGLGGSKLKHPTTRNNREEQHVQMNY